jgi:hypothetical protein
MEIPTTPQLLQDIKRHIELNYNRFIKKTIKLQTQEFKLFDYTAYIDNWKIKWLILPVLHEMYCSEYDDNGEMNNNTIIGKCTECNNEEGYKVIILIYYNKIQIKRLEQNTMLDGNPLTWNNLEHKLSFLENTIKMCNCGKKAKNNDKCRKCHLFSYTRTEEEGGDCAICLENGGLWHKLECEHILHRECLKKISKPVCPLCRAVFKYSLHDIYNNPYKN